ncbi:MAG: dihydroorotate dehydrogenase [Clostridiales bacterium]|nr:dihydroorotate dehydrogenase [Clostridiales bacterium]MBP5417635.1 dihydroorotate dehydrogenase [Clostridiales bacterium]
MSISVKVGQVNLKNPIILASGTCGFGRELAEYMDLSKLGALSSKGLTLLPRDGNQGVRVAETPSGMLNCVGLQNPGVDAFLATELDYMVESGAGVVVNVAGHSNEDYISMVEKLDPYKDKIDALELNFSCPNVKEGCMVIGSSPKAIEALVSDLRKRTDLPLWVKLTPNVTSIAETAKGAEAGGADAIVAINTMLGMAIDIRTRRPLLHNNTGGLSGPCVKPVALRMVHDIYDAVNIPVVGCGGVSTYEDVLEFMIAGASAVELGTITLVHPTRPVEIVSDLEKYCEMNNIEELSSLTGTLELWR